MNGNQQQIQNNKSVHGQNIGQNQRITQHFYTSGRGHQASFPMPDLRGSLPLAITVWIVKIVLWLFIWLIRLGTSLRWKTILWLSVASLVITSIGATPGIIASISCSHSCTSGSLNSLVLYGYQLVLVGVVLGFVSWVGAIAHAYRRQEWIWFALIVTTLLFPLFWIAVPIYAALVLVKQPSVS
ncbi:MAG TPA: hypothetical protein VGL94_17190 [Ktedonobacteraceae bacterium]